MSFKSDNFCHIASNNRNNVKVGVFIYRTTDDLATVSANGYFNGRITDINLHDLIIHEKIDASDNTKVERNVLCVVVRTLDNVGTAVIASKWEKDIEDTIDGLDDVFLKLDGSNIMTAPLRMIAGSMRGAIAPYWNGIGIFKVNTDESQSVSLVASLDEHGGLVPATNNALNLGSTNKKWKKLYVPIINNGGDLAVPTVSGTLATKQEVDTAANSGDQLYTTGVWYAKMYAATTPPASAEVEGRNYADFSQVDGEGNPIIVVYTYTSGAWTTTETITPPAEYNGYMTITSKIWDISEQTGQQGGLVLWSHNQKTFTPYPRIVSFEDVAITGNSTVVMPAIPTGNQIVNKDYVDTTAQQIRIFDSSDSYDDIVSAITTSPNKPVLYLGGDGYTRIFGGLQPNPTNHLAFLGYQESTGEIGYISISKKWQDGTTTVETYPLTKHVVIEFQAPTAQNNYTWYRKYADGWVEQGGFATSSQAGTQVNLPIEMADSNYPVQATVMTSSSNYSTGILSRTTTYFKLATYNETRDCSWEVKGMAA